jgi:large subunit ribosomal protein L1
MDDTVKHDPLQQTEDENIIEAEEIEAETDTAEVRPAEEGAVHTDTEIALEATEATVGGPEEVADRKHKTRESTSEKAKRAARERKARGEQVSESGAPLKQLDPLRTRGKKYRAKVGLILKDTAYPIDEAIELVKQTNIATFDAAVELHVKIKAENVRGTVVLPHGNGKKKRVVVADDVVLEEIAAGKFDFDVLLSTPAMMPKLAKYAKALGPKGLMPSPKAGTVTDDIEKTKAEIEGGRVEYRADKTGVVHMSIGKVSFSADQLKENFSAIEQALTSSKIMAISLASTMGPGVKVQVSK